MEDIFSYQENKKDEKVFIFWRGKQVRILKGREAQIFAAKISGLDQQGRQMLMAKLTGHFKRGNERESKE